MKFVFGIVLTIFFVAFAFATPVAKPILGFGGGYSGSNGKNSKFSIDFYNTKISFQRTLDLNHMAEVMAVILDLVVDMEDQLHMQMLVLVHLAAVSVDKEHLLK